MDAAKNDKWTIERAKTKSGLKLLTDFCRDGLTDIEISKKIGVTNVTISRWRARDKAIRAAMDDARGITSKSSTYDMQHIETRDARTNPTRYHKIALKPRKIDINTVRETIAQWEDDRHSRKQALTRESLCKALGISINEYRRIIEDRAILDDGGMVVNTTSGMIRNEIAEALRQADYMILSDITDCALTKNSIGAIFLLKNHWGYQDKTTTEIQDNTISVQWQQIDGAVYRANTPQTDDTTVRDDMSQTDNITPHYNDTKTKTK